MSSSLPLLSNSHQKGPKVANRLSNIGKNNLLTPVALAHFPSGISQYVLRLSVHNSQSNSLHGNQQLNNLFGENPTKFRYF